MKIVVLAGGLSPERNVSLSSGTKIAEALQSKGHQVALVDMYFGEEDYPGLTGEALYGVPLPEKWRSVDRQAPDLEEVRKVRKWSGKGDFGPGVLELCKGADVVFLALHGRCGEDGRVQAAFDLLGIPYTGAGYLSSAMSMDKDLTKRLVAGQVKTPRWETVTVTEERIPELVARAALPAVVKPIASGSSVGVYIVNTRAELENALAESVKLGGRTVIEEYISGRELSVAVLEGRALPSIEIIPKVGFYDYANKYQPGATQEVCPAQIPAQWEERAGQAAVAVFQALGLSVYARADFMVTGDGTLYFLEINTLPGMTPTSLVPQEAAAAGIDYPTLCETIIRASLEARKGGL